MWSLYQHSNGRLYLRLGTALHSESCEPLDVYRTVYDNDRSSTWARPREMFYEEVVPGRKRFTEVGRVRTMMPEDRALYLAFGHDAWGGGSSVEEFVASYAHNKNHLRGTRYLLESGSSEPIGNLNTIRFARGLVGMASLLVNPNQRGRGYGSILTRAVMEILRCEDPGIRFMLYSEVNLSMHEKIGFSRLPNDVQSHLPAVAMATDDAPITEHELPFLRECF